MIKRYLQAPGIIWRYIIVKIFGLFYYDKKYRKSKWFNSPNEWGYKWAYIDICNRLKYKTNYDLPWPCSPLVDCGKNVIFDPDDLNNIAGGVGNYYQTFDAKIVIGKGTWIARNVGIITSNHDLKNPNEHQPGKDVIIGDCCWIGMNSIILPGVVLGDHTVVGAGAVVTKSFPDGHCVIAGNPAKLVRLIEVD
ncbi:MAG: acyltransferase [Saccharofermentans sp.]|nr:acyltransferase [Saccharofermentans sp.]